MTSDSEPRFWSRRVRSSMISMSGRRPWTFWAYHSGVEKPHQLTIAAFGCIASRAWSVHVAASSWWLASTER